MKRTHISLKTKLAAALLQLGHVPYEDAKNLTADQILSLYRWDHYPIRHEAGGPDEPWNLQPMLIAAHQEKTAKVDIPQAAKVKRLRRKETVHQQAMSQDDTQNYDFPRLKPKRRIPSRPFPSKGSRRFPNAYFKRAPRKT